MSWKSRVKQHFHQDGLACGSQIASDIDFLRRSFCLNSYHANRTESVTPTTPDWTDTRLSRVRGTCKRRKTKNILRK
jgi:hypothetical protein